MKINLKKKFTWIVTGGAGFIGSNLIKLLIKQNQNIICIDNLETGFKKNINYKNYKNFKFIKKDIRKLKLIDLEGKKIDFVIHLAALGSVPRSFDNPQKTNSVNVDGSLNIIKICKEIKCKKLIFASSSSIYGDQKPFPKKESSDVNPINLYSLSKLSNEQFAQSIGKTINTTMIGLRFFTIYGPWGRPDMMIIKYLISAYKKLSFPLYNNGDHFRDFTYIDDAIDICFSLLNKKIKKNLKFLTYVHQDQY